MGLTLAITHFERWRMLLECLQHVQDDSRIDEIVIVDDASRDGSYEELLQWFYEVGDDRVRLHRNEVNLDCYANKAQAVRLSSNNWVALFDSDNVLPRSYLDALDNARPWLDETAYLPVFARPEFDYREFAGQRVTRANVAELCERPMFTTALNTANYVVPRSGYLDVWDASVNPRTVDSLFMNYRWLASGRALYFVPGMEYDHRMHDGSHYVQNHTRSDDLISRRLEQKLRELH